MIFEDYFYVYYSETDAGGVVYHTKYIEFCEKCRTDFLRKLEFNQSELLKDYNIGFVVSSINANFKMSAKLDDYLKVTIDAIENISCKLIFHQSIFNQNNDLLFKAEIVVVTIDNNHKLYRKIPEYILNKMLNN